MRQDTSVISVSMSERIERIRPVLIGGTIGALAIGGLFFGLLHTWSARANDRLFLSHPTDASITIVAIDDASLGRIGRWPWSRRIHANLISKLSAAGAKVIAYDVNFPEPSTHEDDQALADAIRDAGNVVLPTELSLQMERDHFTYDPHAVVAPISLIRSAAKATGHSNTPPDVDGIVRRIPVFVYAPDGDSSVVPSFAVEALRVAGFEDTRFLAPTDSTGQLVVNFAGPPFRSFRTLSAADILRGTTDLSLLKDKIVFIGSTAADLHDALLVPTSDGLPMPGIEIHASLFDTILHQRWLRHAPMWALLIELMGLALLVSVLVSRLRPRVSLLATILVWIGTVSLAFALFDLGWLVDIVWPTLTIFFAYAVVTLERRITADRQRRQFKQALSQYVSPSVVEAILRDPSKLKLGGERRRMSVLFSDIRGFTTISEGMTPEKLVQILNIYLDRMTNLVFANTGVLDKYIGDAVMAFWNAPFDQPAHAKLAVATAIDMRDALAEMNRAKQFGDIELRIGIGVNTGDMIVGNVGGASRFDYTVIGDHVNLASRLEGLTKEYHVDILVTEATVRELGADMLTRKLDKVAVKGKKEPIVIYEVMEPMRVAVESHQTLARDFEVALESYFAKKFQDARARCDAILVTHPDDGPTSNLRERARAFITNPPPESWNGAWIYTKK